MTIENKSRLSPLQVIVPLIAVAAIVGAFLVVPPASSRASDSDLPDTITVYATIRDFRAKESDDGHPDFESYAGTVTVGLVEENLGSDGKPVVRDLRGQKVYQDFTDSQGRCINPAMCDPSKGDVRGKLGRGIPTNGIYSVESFSQWYRDTPGVNASTTVPIVLTRQGDSDRYVFDSATDGEFTKRGGFFPIDGELYGDFHSSGHNFHFTTEIETQFVYESGTGQIFKFTGDDDVWVFIDGRLVIDMGGLHPRDEQFLDLDRLDWLRDGSAYQLKIFHAERHTSQSNFRIETTLNFRRVELPPTTGLHD